MNKKENNMDIQSIHSEKVPSGISSHHCHAKVVGNFVFISGLIARLKNEEDIPGIVLDEQGNIIHSDVEKQFGAIMKNLQFILDELSLSISDIVDVTVFLTDIKKDFKKFNEVYGTYFNHILPARTTVEVSRFPSPVTIEVKFIAYIKNKIK